MFAVTQMLFDAVANGFPGPGQLAGHGGFVFAEQPARLRQREVLRVVARQSKPIARVERGDDDRQRTRDQREVPRSLGIGLSRGRRHGQLVVERRLTAPGADAIDMLASPYSRPA